MFRSRVPVIVGVAQITDTTSAPDRARSPLGLMVDAARRAATDAGAQPLLTDVDSLIAVRMFADAVPRFKSPFGRILNPPWSVACRIGANPRELVYTPGGGTMPQVALNWACERIARGESQIALLTGAEALRTELEARRAGIQLDWSEDAPAEPEQWGGYRTPYSEHEYAHGIAAAINVYPLFEQSIRAARGSAIDAHQQSMGRLFARFAAVARDNPLATRRRGYSAEEIATPTEANPILGFPYTKLLSASVYVDQAAAVIVCSASKADDLGIAESKRVYLHGCSQADDHWFVTERANLHSSPAIRSVVRKTFEMAGRGPADAAAFDLYSCFPSAVEIACAEIGLSEDDPRPFTVTGGLLYFGGPGNNYVMHSIASMIERCRHRPGSFGLVTANGNYVTRHAAGLYSTTPIAREWRREDPAMLQRELDALPKSSFTEHPHGDATVESYTVVHSKSGPERGIVVGRLAATGERFIANTVQNRATFHIMETVDLMGAGGFVHPVGGLNRFEFR